MPNIIHESWMRSPQSGVLKDGREQRRKLTFAAIMPRSLRLQNGAESARCGMADSGFVLRGRFTAPHDDARGFASAVVAESPRATRWSTLEVYSFRTRKLCEFSHSPFDARTIEGGGSMRAHYA